MKKKVFIGLFMAFSMSGIAQVSPFLQKGKSGFGISGLYEKAEGFQGCLGGIRGTYKGILELDFTYNYDDYNGALSGLTNPNATSGGFMTGLTWWFLNGEIVPNIKGNVGLRAGLDSYSFNGFDYVTKDGTPFEYLGYLNLEMGMIATLNFRIGEFWIIQPFYSLDFEFSQEKSPLAQASPEDLTSGISSRLGLSIGRKISNKSWLLFNLFQHEDSYSLESYYNLGIGYVVELSSHK